MENNDFYKELREIRRQILEVANPLAREVLTKHVPETRTADDFKAIIASTLVEITKLEARIIEMEQKYLEREKDTYLGMVRTNIELQQMTEAEKNWQEKVDNYTLK